MRQLTSNNWIAVAPAMPQIGTWLESIYEPELRRDIMEVRSPRFIAARAVLARALGFPVRAFRIVAEVGRMVWMQYEPLGDDDPNIVLMVGGQPREQTPFNNAMLAFQAERLTSPYGNRRAWYARVDQAASRVGAALLLANPTEAEAELVLGFVATVRDAGVWIA